MYCAVAQIPSWFHSAGGMPKRPPSINRTRPKGRITTSLTVPTWVEQMEEAEEEEEEEQVEEEVVEEEAQEVNVNVYGYASNERDHRPVERSATINES